MTRIKLIFISFLLLLIPLFCPNLCLAQDNQVNFEAKVIEIISETQIKPANSDEKQISQELKLLITSGEAAGQEIVIKTGNLPIGQNLEYQPGNRVLIGSREDIDGQLVYYIADFVRRPTLLWLFIIFTVLALIVARFKGLASLLSMVITFLIIFWFILPQISAGKNPILISILGSLVIIPVTFYLSHGFNKKTTVAVGSTLISLMIAGILAIVFVNSAHLTGFASEEAAFLQVAKSGQINIKNLLLAGIIIGLLGVLDDITISQSAIVFELKKTNPKLDKKQLFKKAMTLGQDHISSMINTLILVYAGASLPLLLLFMDNPQPFYQVVNYEIIADEVIRTLVASIGLILAVPITTFLASVWVRKD